MAFDESWIEYIPERAEFSSELEDQVGGDFERAVHELDDYGVPVNVDALSWVFRLAQESEHADRVVSTVPWLDRLAVGFFDPELGEEPGFGFIAYSSFRSDLQLAPDIEMEMTEDRVRQLSEQLDVEVDGINFRTVVRTGRREQQVAVTAPSSALTTAVGRSNRVGADGWLLPRHAVQVNARVEFSDGSSGRVVEDWGECIDAVLVGSPGLNGAGLSSTSCVRGISPSITVEVADAAGQSQRHTVTDVDINVGVVRSHLFPIRFTYDWATSSRGDSGALIVADPCGEPLGMHQGAVLLSTQAGTVRRAYGLCLYQLEDHGGLEILQ